MTDNTQLIADIKDADAVRQEVSDLKKVPAKASKVKGVLVVNGL